MYQWHLPRAWSHDPGGMGVDLPALNRVGVDGSLVPEPCRAPPSSAGDSVVAYLTTVLTDLLHSQRDPLALCLLLQAYDQLAPPDPQGRLLPCCFSSYYRLWIPEPAREAEVSGCHAPVLPQGPACPRKRGVLPTAQLCHSAGDTS